MKKVFYLLCFIFIFLPLTVNAEVSCTNGEYSATVELSKNEIFVGDEIVVIVEASEVYAHRLSYDIKDEAIISADGYIIKGLKYGTTEIDITVRFVVEDEEVGSCKTTFEVQVVSGDATLSSLNIDEYDMSNIFKSDQYEYTINLPYNLDKINIVAVPSDEYATVTGDGRRYLNEGTNEFEIIVKATDENTKTYKLIVEREPASDNSALKSLIIEGYVLTPKFSSDTYNYSLNVSKEVDDINISAIGEDENATILGIGKYTLASGLNTIYVNVVAENGNRTRYSIEVFKTKGSSLLSNLKVEGYSFREKFDSNRFIYTLNVPYDMENINIITEVLDNEKVEIIGNKNLVVGENIVFVKVFNEDKTTTTYKIIVNRLSLEEMNDGSSKTTLSDVFFVIFIITIVVFITVIVIFLIINSKKMNREIKKNKKMLKNNKKSVK